MRLQILVIHFILVCIPFVSVVAMPAYPRPISVQVGSKTTYIKLFGDEHCKWAENEEGYTLIQNEDDQWCYARMNPDGTLKASPHRLDVKSVRQRSVASFLAETPLHLKPSYSQPHNSSRRNAGKVVGERRVLVILMNFQDRDFVKRNVDFDNLFNQVGYTDDGAQGSVRDYYQDVSYGQLKLTGDIYGPYTAAHPMRYYGGNSFQGGDINPYELFVEAIEHVAHETDLKLYDADGDGFTDNVHIIYAGYGEEAGGPASSIWAHEMTFGRPYEIGGMKIDRYSCAPELRGKEGNGISRIGPHCHEIGHALGAMDYYDTNYNTDGEFVGTGMWDVMASGSWNEEGAIPADFNPYVKSKDYGWITPQALPSGRCTIHPSNIDSGSYYMLANAEGGDYYLLENRINSKWGAGLPGQGLLLFHIHSRITKVGNKINATAPQMCYVVCASSREKRPGNSPDSYGGKETGGRVDRINTAGCPFPGSTNNTNFGKISTPMAFFWDNDECGIELRNITMSGNHDVILDNASVGSGQLPIETVGLFFEGFEGEQTHHVIDNGGMWQVIENPINQFGFADRPIAYTGSKCLQLSARGKMFGTTMSSIEFEIPETKENGNVHFLFYYTSYGIARNANTLRIGYQTKGSGEWTFSEVKSSVNSIWNSFGIKFPDTDFTRIKIEGVAQPNSILAIDNIEIEQELVTKIASKRTGFNIAPSTIYSLSGAPVPSLTRGLNIIHQSDGTFKKVLVK